MTTGLVYSDRGHSYHLDGVRLPSVTAILGVIHKPELVTWVGRLGNEEANRQRDEAATFGTAAHAVCEQIANGSALSVLDCPPEIAPLADAFDGWFQTSVRTVIAAEPRVASRLHQCAGSIDLVAEMVDGGIAIVDLKTGSMVPNTTPLQTAAYGRLLAEQDGIQATRRLAVHLPRKRPGELTVIEYPAEEELNDWHCFLACRIIYGHLFTQAKPLMKRPAASRPGAGR